MKDVDEKKLNNLTKIIAVSKTFPIDKILPLIEHGHLDFGENKVQEAVDKWTDIKKRNSSIRLHMIGKLQTNKVKLVVPLFDYIHSLDNYKLAKKISDEQNKNNKKLKNLFILKKKLIKKMLVSPKQNKYIPMIYSVPNGPDNLP